MVNRQPKGKTPAISTARSLFRKSRIRKTDPSGIPSHPNTPGNLIRFVRRKSVNTSEYRANERGEREGITILGREPLYGGPLSANERGERESITSFWEYFDGKTMLSYDTALSSRVQMNQEKGMEGGVSCDPSPAFAARSRQERGCTFRADCQWPAEGSKFGRATLPLQDQPVLL